MKWLVLGVLLLSCNTSNTSYEAEKGGDALEQASALADEVASNHPETAEDMEVMKVHHGVAKEALSVLKEATEQDEGFPWFKTICCVGAFAMGALILKMSLPVGNLVNTLAGASVCMCSVSLYFYWDFIGEKLVPYVLGGLLVYKMILLTYYKDKQRADDLQEIIDSKTYLAKTKPNSGEYLDG